MTAFSDEPGDGVLARAAALLDAFDDEHRELTLAALVGRSGLPRSTAHRMAAQMVALGWLDKPGGRYRIGNRLFALSGLAHAVEQQRADLAARAAVERAGRGGERDARPPRDVGERGGRGRLVEVHTVMVALSQGHMATPSAQPRPLDSAYR